MINQTMCCPVQKSHTKSIKFKDRFYKCPNNCDDYLKDIYNEVQGYVISLNDFTEQFFVLHNNQMLATSLDNSQEGNVVVAVEDDIKILYVNQCFRTIFQTSDKALVNTSLKQFFGKNFNENIVIALQERSTYSADTVITCADDTQKITNWTLSPFSENKDTS